VAKPDTTEPDTNEPSTPAKPSPAKVKGAEEIDREADYRSVKTNSLKRSLSSMELPGEVFGNLELFDFVIYIYIYIYISHTVIYTCTHIGKQRDSYTAQIHRGRSTGGTNELQWGDLGTRAIDTPCANGICKASHMTPPHPP
jgi:hypothetical protein